MTAAPGYLVPGQPDLKPLRRAGALRFRYNRQPTTFTRRFERATRRRLLPHAAPPSAGLRYTHARPEAVALLNRLADELTSQARLRRVGVWLNSAVRSQGQGSDTVLKGILTDHRDAALAVSVARLAAECYPG